VPAMKLTPNAAMRARDVSRPHAEHLAEAEAAEAKGSAGRSGPASGGAETVGGGTGGPETGRPEMGRAGDDRAGRPGFPRRRGRATSHGEAALPAEELSG
jgi:hypothetical protein